MNESTKREQKPVIFLICFFLSVVGKICAQGPPMGSLFGSVIDDSTKAPVISANIFLANTLTGTTSDQEGKFELKNIPVGSYQVVVSMVGYNRHIQDIMIGHDARDALLISLKPRMIQSAAVEVTAEEPTGWKEKFKFFEREFLGTTKNAEKCKIINPEILDFRGEGGSTFFEVMVPEKPLVIENRALGYRIEYILQTFQLRSKELIYEGVPKFSVLQADNIGEAEEWQENQRKAYFGSFRHFLASLYLGTWEEESFRAYRKQEIASTYKEEIRPGQIVKRTPMEGFMRLTFSGYLEVTYTKEDPDPAYDQFRGRWTIATPGGQPRRTSDQTSWFTLLRPDVLVDANGRIFGNFSSEVSGYWAFERFAEVVPLEYKPK